MDYNVFEVLLLAFTLIITFLGIWINYFRSCVPALVHKATFLGQTTYNGGDAKFVNLIEIPKSSFKHFYIFACFFSTSSLIFMISVYFFNVNVNGNIRLILDGFMKNQQPVSVLTALVAMTLFAIHCSRRLYETLYLQVFSKKSKMNVLHFLLAIAHYFICISAILGASPLFCGNQNRKDIFWGDTSSAIPYIAIFAWASYEQHQSNIILANLRKHKDSGVVVTEEYKLPFGKLFNFISNPHRLTEILIYLALAQIMRTKTWFLILIWVTSNQLQASIATHLWYKNTFSKYPTERYALVPGLI